MQLIFQERRMGGVEQEVTQRDQFNTDEVSLVAALVREPHQNSLDAKSAFSTGATRTRISIVEPTEENEAYFNKLFSDLEPHLVASEIDIADIDFGRPRLLLIEDFGTTGLVGKIDDPDDERPFCDFWRRFGKSHKGGAKGGRWGLGKLVYSSASQIGIFFGLTIRDNDAERGALLMGQAVLMSHNIGTHRYMPHGFFCIPRADGLELPVDDKAEIAEFKEACRITRTDEPGLSIVIPFVLEEITAKKIIPEVLKNYFFPILTGQLEVEVGDELISAMTFDDVAARYAASENFSDVQLIQFIRQIHSATTTPPDVVLAPHWRTNVESAIDEATLPKLRERFSKGDLIHVRAPIALTPKTGNTIPSNFDLFLKRTPEGIKGEALYVRSAITVPDERRYFHPRQTFGALIARDTGITSFLGDAETPSHTQWNGGAAKLKKNWQAGAARLSEVRNSLDWLHQALAQSVDVIEPDALKDYFSIQDASAKPGPKPPGLTPPVPPIPKTEKKFSITGKRGGFAIKAGSGLTPDDLPMTIAVKVAYDVFRGNPFKRFSEFDFNFKESGLNVIEIGAVCLPASANSLEIEVTDLEFTVEISGFDANRDIVVQVR